MSVRLWTRDEVEQAIALYCVTPFGRFHSRNPEIIELAQRLDRTPSSIAMKLSNLAALDSSLPQKGMANFSKLDKEVWHDFFAQPLLLEPNEEAFFGFAEEQAIFDHGGRSGEDRQGIATIRTGQGFFRQTVLTAYRNKCAVTGVTNSELLVASHIVPWARDKSPRLDPTNGICLNAFYDKAFDRGLITFDTDFRLIASTKLTPHTREHVDKYVGQTLSMPERFLPSQQHLDYHRNSVFVP